jgi:predicted MFS family arabinose efflux permease
MVSHCNRRKWSLQINGLKQSRILFIIVVAQFCCTSLWFAGNAVIADVVREFGFKETALGHITSAVQFGFITGTLLFAMFTVADRFSPSKIFFICALCGALLNMTVFLSSGLSGFVLSRFLTGFCLAGVYPVGMKIASDHHDKGLGKALGYLVGALVLGTALPHLLKGLTMSVSWRYVIVLTSVLSVVGGLLILFVPDGPHRSSNNKFDATVFYRVFKDKKFRSVVLGYFGHMWELYSFWAFLPVIIVTYLTRNKEAALNIPILSFAVIASGALSCVAGGYIAQKTGSAKTAFIALALSFVCCLLSPMLFYLPVIAFVIILFIWGMAVIADSPQFSTLIAQAAPAASKGTALTIGNSIGFSITIVSIQCISLLMQYISPAYVFLFLAIGPLLGLIAMRKII